MITRKQIEKVIKLETGYNITLQRGEGYFYFTSEDKNTDLKLCRAYTASVYVFRLYHLTLAQWVESFKGIIKSVDLYPYQKKLMKRIMLDV